MKKALFNRLNDESGYSLVEVVVAIMLLSLAIIPMVGMFDAGLRAAVLGGNYDQARVVANEQLEEVKALPFSSPDPAANGTENSVEEIYPAPGTRACTPPIEAGFTCKVETAYASLGTTSVNTGGSSGLMMKVTVKVTWNGESNSYTTTGLISK